MGHTGRERGVRVGEMTNIRHSSLPPHTATPLSQSLSKQMLGLGWSECGGSVWRSKIERLCPDLCPVSRPQPSQNTLQPPPPPPCLLLSSRSKWPYNTKLLWISKPDAYKQLKPLLLSLFNHLLYCWATVVNTFRSPGKQNWKHCLEFPTKSSPACPILLKNMLFTLLTPPWPHWLSACSFIPGGANER